MKKILLILLVAVIGILFFEFNKPVNMPKVFTAKKQAEVTEGDFVYRIFSEKEKYKIGEQIKVYAELEYIGDKEEITIFHAASPFIFNLKELSRGFDLPAAMNEPLLSTTLKRGEPLRKEYGKSGDYVNGAQDDYNIFKKRFLKDKGFPDGNYVLDGQADFYIGNSNKKEEDFLLEAQIRFKVEK
jgi:hypothetical protein